MDHRCLYGHRVASTFRYAIDNDACPICGAELISVDGYKLARTLAEGVPLDGVAAFRTARVLLRRYVLTPLDAQDAGDTAIPTPDVPAGTEVQLDEEDLLADDDRDQGVAEEVLVPDLDEADDEQAAASGTEDTVVAPAPILRPKPDDSEASGFSDVDEAFFAEGATPGGA